MRNDFAVFIITHGRPDKQFTYKALRECGYSGKIYFVIDDTDTTIQEYINNFGVDNILVFDKNYYINSDRFDNGTNEGIFACATYARRAVEDIAKCIGLKFFCMADDDITKFVIRYNFNGTLKRIKLIDIDSVFDTYLDFFADKPIGCIGFSNPSIFFDKDLKLRVEGLLDLPLNLFIRKTTSITMWSCWYGEDDIAAINANKTGSLWLNIPYVMREITNLGTGAMCEIYASKSSYLRTFAKFRYNPSDFYITLNVKGQLSGQYVLRKASKSMFPKIISDRYKRKEN